MKTDPTKDDFSDWEPASKTETILVLGVFAVVFLVMIAVLFILYKAIPTAG